MERITYVNPDDVEMVKKDLNEVIEKGSYEQYLNLLPIPDVYEKLYQIENIEQKLGIDFITLFKALKKGIWIKTDDCVLGYKIEKTPVFIKKVDIGYQDYDEVDENYNQLIEEKNVLCIYETPYDGLGRCARIKDYGRTWALAREELEK